MHKLKKEKKLPVEVFEIIFTHAKSPDEGDNFLFKTGKYLVYHWQKLHAFLLTIHFLGIPMKRRNIEKIQDVGRQLVKLLKHRRQVCNKTWQNLVYYEPAGKLNGDKTKITEVEYPDALNGFANA